jgi:hypothetical protein
MLKHKPQRLPHIFHGPDNRKQVAILSRTEAGEIEMRIEGTKYKLYRADEITMEDILKTLDLHEKG